MKICQRAEEDYPYPFYTECLKCSIETCPIRHLLERIDKLEDLVYQLEAKGCC